MTEYVLKNGYVLTDEEIEKRVQDFEEGKWESPGIVLKAGRPKLSEEPLKNISFKCPQSVSDLIDAACMEMGIKKSVFLREAALIAASNVLLASKD